MFIAKMSTLPSVALLTFLVTVNVDVSQSARILVAVPTPSYSHQVSYHRIWKILSMRGHEMVLVTANTELYADIRNITFIDIKSFYNEVRTYDFVRLRYEMSWMTLLETRLFDTLSDIGELLFNHPGLQKLYAADSTEEFDLLIIEALFSPCLYSLGHRFGIPIIGLTSLGLPASQYFREGLPLLPSHPSTWEMEDDAGFNVPFWKRVRNFIRLWYHIFQGHEKFFQRQQEIVDKHLGEGYPRVLDMARNLSMVFSHHHPVLSYARPTLQKIVHYGFIHILDKLPPLPKELKIFMDNATNGFIYFSLGTNAKSSSLSDETRRIFCDVFRTLPYKVVWKYEANMSNTPDNVLIVPWLPQQTVLAHRNIKLFIYQGGYQSTEEAVYYGVPLVGIPILADQHIQVKKMMSLGVARRIDICNMDRETVEEIIHDVLTDKRYKERMLELRDMVKDEPKRQVDKLISWIEFVIRHKGAPHLKYSLADEHWYRRYDIDIIAFLSVVAFIGLICILIASYKFIVAVSRCYTRSRVKQKKKVS